MDALPVNKHIETRASLAIGVLFEEKRVVVGTHPYGAKRVAVPRCRINPGK